MKTKYFIQDWAGNDKTNYYGEFDTFEDAWEAVYEFVRTNYPESEFEECVGEYFVEEREV